VSVIAVGVVDVVVYSGPEPHTLLALRRIIQLEVLHSMPYIYNMYLTMKDMAYIDVQTHYMDAVLHYSRCSSH